MWLFYQFTRYQAPRCSKSNLVQYWAWVWSIALLNSFLLGTYRGITFAKWYVIVLHGVGRISNVFCLLLYIHISHFCWNWMEFQHNVNDLQFFMVKTSIQFSQICLTPLLLFLISVRSFVSFVSNWITRLFLKYFSSLYIFILILSCECLTSLIL